MEFIRKIWNEKPLATILWAAFLVRMIAVFFAKGFGMFDDHYIVIEPAYSWVHGGDYNNWLPGGESDSPLGLSFFYPGLNYLYFLLAEFLGIRDPQKLMLINRFLHALFSLITVYLGYKIALKLYNQNAAKIAGVLLALYWFMPWLSVRNLVEVVCIPILFLGSWTIIKDRDKYKILSFCLAGIYFGLAFSVRYQTLIFTGGVLLALLILKRWKEVLALAGGLVLIVILTQGLVDYLIWDLPFGQIREYINHNIVHAHDYVRAPWYSYILLISAILIPPISLFLIYGFFRTWRKHLVLFLPVILFLIFHIYFPNKQERFILPIIPFFVVLGVIGWQEFKERSKFWKRHSKLVMGCWIFFWTLNLIVLPVATTMYSKKARVESMTYLSKYENVEYLLLEDVNRWEILMPPTFYLGESLRILYELSGRHPYDSLKVQIENYGEATNPRFVLFFDEKDLDTRVESVKILLPNIVFETTIKPGFLDQLIYRLNPINANETVTIYKNTDFYPEKIDE